MRIDEMIEIDRVVRHGLGVGPGEAVDEVARRIVAQGEGPFAGTSRMLAACEILRGGDPWACMRAAAAHLRPRLVS